MKLAKPILPTMLAATTVAEILVEGALDEAQVTGGDATNASVAALDLSSVVIEKLTFIGAHFERMNARDLVVKGGDGSGAVLADGNFNRAEFRGCRLAGLDLNKTALHDVVFTGCKLDMANFRLGDLRRVRFIECSLTEADFLGATLHDVSFESCTLNQAVFTQARCKNVDLRTSDLAEVEGWSSLKGATIDSLQLVACAPYLAREMGLVIK